MACTKASIDVFAKTEYGRFSSISPIKIDLSGNSASICNPNLLFKVSISTTATLVTSLPVPHVVGIAINSLFLFNFSLSLNN